MNTLNLIKTRLWAAWDELGDACFAAFEWLEEGEEFGRERISSR